MNLIRYNPMRDLWNMRNEMDRLFNQLTSRTFDSDEMADLDWSPRVDISENKDNIIVKAELPGMSKDDVKISMQDNVLYIRGEKKAEKESKDDNYHLCESCYGKFMRAFRLPAPVNEKKIDASYKDGVLRIILPKAEEAKSKEIEIKMS